MNCMTYSRMKCEKDPDIARLLSALRKPEIARFYSIDGENYFSYVTNTENVYFYKVYRNGELTGAVHLEKQEATLFMSILVMPEFQRMGMGTRILKDILDNGLGLDYRKLEVSVDESNTASRRLFEKFGFTGVSQDEELINYVFHKA